MPLLSQLFSGDAALEDAANRDAAHITRGARGPHVVKIQQALNILDGAGLQEDGVYGAVTANAVLQYKSKRAIINRSYQSVADDIVGRMTIAKLDDEMRAHESRPAARVRLIPISPRPSQEKAHKLQLAPSKAKSIIAFKIGNVLPTEMVSIEIGATAQIEVQNGQGFELTIGLEHPFDPRVKIVDPDTQQLVRSIEITKNSMTVRARGLTWGTHTLIAHKPHLLGPSTDIEKLVIEVRDNRPNVFHPTSAHHHEPVSEPTTWEAVCKEAAKDPVLIFTLRKLAENNASPETVSSVARVSLLGPLGGEPTAIAHFDHYLFGTGGTVNDDKVLKTWVEGSRHTRSIIAKRIREHKRPGDVTVEFNFEYNATMYDDENIKDSFGTIDTLDVFADFVKGTVELWFEDTYEWHPIYSQYTQPFRCPNTNAGGLVSRDTAFLHAAMVQMKRRGARDYQIRANATFPMKIFSDL